MHEGRLWGPVEGGGGGGGEDCLTVYYKHFHCSCINRPLVCKGTLGLLQSKVHVSFFCFPFLHIEKFNTGI